MSDQPHTPGPWRWEINRQSKSIQLVGGRPQGDKTVMDFERWGMHSAAPRFNAAIVGNEFNIMYAPQDHTGWVQPFPGRGHHAKWCADVDHPDARLIAAAPELLHALRHLMHNIKASGKRIDLGLAPEMAAAAIAKATGETA
jgi:hypothetical protein